MADEGGGGGGSDGDNGVVAALRVSLVLRLAVLGFNQSAADAWLARLHFGYGGYGGWRGTSLDDVLSAWRSPINLVSLPPTTAAAAAAAAANPRNARSMVTSAPLSTRSSGSTNSTSDGGVVAGPRLDGHFGWCAWPEEVEAVNLLDGGEELRRACR